MPDHDAASASGALSYAERERAAQLLIRAFAPERYAYLLLTMLSTVGLLGLAAWRLIEDPDWSTVAALFGPSGVIVFSQGRVLHIWNRTADLLTGGRSVG